MNLLIVNTGASFRARGFSQITSALGFFLLFFLTFSFIFRETCCCKLGAEIASAVSAAELGLASTLVAGGADLHFCSLMMFQECTTFNIRKSHRI